MERKSASRTTGVDIDVRLAIARRGRCLLDRVLRRRGSGFTAAASGNDSSKRVPCAELALRLRYRRRARARCRS